MFPQLTEWNRRRRRHTREPEGYRARHRYYILARTSILSSRFTGNSLISLDDVNNSYIPREYKTRSRAIHVNRSTAKTKFRSPLRLPSLLPYGIRETAYRYPPSIACVRIAYNTRGRVNSAERVEGRSLAHPLTQKSIIIECPRARARDDASCFARGVS